MFRRRTLLVAFVAFALIAAGCSKRDSESAEGRQEAQSGTTSVSDVLDNFKTEIDNGLLTDSMKAVFPNLELPSESSDAINKLNNELADLAKTDPKKAACTGISVLEGIVTGISDAATQLSPDAQAVVTESLKPTKAGVDELAQQKQYKKSCSGSGNDSTLPNQSELITQLLEPIVGGWDTETLICLVLKGLLTVDVVIIALGILFAIVAFLSYVLMPLALLVFWGIVVPAIVAMFALIMISSTFKCDSATNEMRSKIHTLDTEKLLELAKKAMP